MAAEPGGGRSGDRHGADVAAGPGHLPELPDADTWRRWGIDPAWSRRLDVPSHAGGSRCWHLLDSAAADADPSRATDRPTVLCVHGNPTWAYAWATFLRRLSPMYRVIAVDQLGMGFSERTVPRRYMDRVRDLDDLIVALDLTGPLVIAGHDWGGAIALGWVVQDPHQVAGMILCNTGIAVPSGRRAPGIIRVAAWAPVLDAVCRGTPAFLEGTLRLSRGRLSKAQRDAFRAPYRSAPDRAAIADFVDDIPLEADGPSAPAIADVAARLHTITAPVLMAWGAKDPVFNDDFAEDLAARLPDVSLHRFADAGHLVMAETDVAGIAAAWLADLETGAEERHDALRVDDVDRPSLWAAIDERAASGAAAETAVVDVAGGTSVSWSELARRVASVAGELRLRGLQPGQRVAVVTPPGVDLVVAVYGIWRAGGVTVIADRGLGFKGLTAAIRSAAPDWVVGPRRALIAARTLRWAPGASHVEIDELIGAGTDAPHDVPSSEDLAAVLFTSGATGPAKGVRYRHRQLMAQRDALAATYDVRPADRLVAAFAPFALYGPAFGITTALPDCDVTTPASLTADALNAACRSVGATLAFASPAALANVVATAPAADTSALRTLRLVLSAGAPVSSELLTTVAELAPEASLHTPYGMTEVLPVADIDLPSITAAEGDDPAGGVCVGTPVAGAEVRIAALGFDAAHVPSALDAGAAGEILVRAPWVSDGYDRLWATERAARPGDGWHRSGDVGHVDEHGRVWVEGRAVHVIDTVDGPVTPVPVERAVERALAVGRSAAVGVGPAGCQQLVVVIEDASAGDGLASSEVAAAVRSAVTVPVAAVLTVASLPVDVRHNAKIDRTAVAAAAARKLSGGGAART